MQSPLPYHTFQPQTVAALVQSTEGRLQSLRATRTAVKRKSGGAEASVEQGPAPSFPYEIPSAEGQGHGGVATTGPEGIESRMKNRMKAGRKSGSEAERE